MTAIFILLFLACIIGLILGLIKPTMVLKWGDLEKRNRKSVLKYYGIGLIVTFILIAAFAPKTTNTGDKSTTAKVETTVKEEPKEKTEEEKAAEVAKQKADEEAKADADAKIAAEKAAKDEKDNIPKEYQSALKKADTYANKMNLSKKGLYEQLTSDAGEKFTEEEAQYAINNLEN